MDSRVYINKTLLSILSIPRSKVWLFMAPILLLLYKQATLPTSQVGSPYHSSVGSGSDSDSEEEESSLGRFESDDHLNASFISTGSGSGSHASLRKAALERLSSQTDNSSKKMPRYQSPRNSLPDLSLIKTRLEREYEQEREPGECFFHIAFTPTECTVICSTSGFDELFGKPLELCMKLGYNDVVVIDKRFFSLQIDSEGEENGSARILEFTQPLSELGISLFFLSSHYSDIVLIPQIFKTEVQDILALKHFVYSPNTNSYMVDYTHTKKALEPPKVLRKLQKDTHKLLRDARIRPRIQKRKKCLLTGARLGEVKSSIDKVSACIAAGNMPDYFAVTRTAGDELSLLLPGSSKKRAKLGFDARSIIGLSLDAIIPITIDLSKLPLDSTGIVAGLASILWESMKVAPDSEELATFEMNYLSMACSAVIMIPEENSVAVTKMVNQFSEEE